jgi:hypothetical protein
MEAGASPSSHQEVGIMRDNRNVVWATIAVAAVMCVLALAQHVAAGAHSDRTTFLTFDQSVRLPGVTLSPGTYVFAFVDPLKSPGGIAGPRTSLA